MSYTQLITPNPDIPCRPGWCLEYVRKTFGLPIRYGSATEAWDNSPTQHQNYDVPDGVWVPLWFSIDTVPEGHVVLRAPDGSVYSSSDNTTTPHHHPNMADLIDYYQRLGNLTLTYLGWTEDMAGTPVIAPSIQAESTIILGDDVAQIDTISDEAAAKVGTAIVNAFMNYDYTTLENKPAKPLWLFQSLNAILHEQAQRVGDAVNGKKV